MKLTASMLTVAALTAGMTSSFASAQQTIVLNSARQLHLVSSLEAKAYSGAAFKPVAKIDGIQVPIGWTGIFVATFNAEAVCDQGPCLLKIFCDGVPLPDSDPLIFSSDSIVGHLDRRTFTLTRYSRVVGGGRHSCDVRSAQQGAAGSHLLDDWVFAVEFWRRS